MSELTATEARGADDRRRRTPYRVAIISVGALLGLLAGLVFTSLQTTRYESTVRLLVGPISGERTTLDAAGLLSSTYAELLTSRSVTQRVSETVQIAIDLDDVSARSDERSRVIVLAVEHEDRSIPPQVADALAEDLTGLVASAQPAPEIGVPRGGEAGQVRVLDPATDPAEEVRDSSVLLLLGALLGAALAYTWVRASAPIRRTVDRRFLEAQGLPVVFALSADRDEPGQDDTWDLAATQIDYECRRTGTYQTVVYVPIDDDPDIVTIFLHLAAAEARTRRPVQIVDADPNHDVIGQLLPPLGVYGDLDPSDPETSQLGPRIIATGDDDRQLLRPGTHMHFVKSRPFADAPGAMARIQRIADRLPAACLMAAFSPPIGSSPTAVSTAVVVDRVVLVVRRGQTRRSEVQKALRALESVGVEPAVVLEAERGRSLGPVTLHYRDANPAVETSAGASFDLR